jgi:hypothetical protein
MARFAGPSSFERKEIVMSTPHHWIYRIALLALLVPAGASAQTKAVDVAKPFEEQRRQVLADLNEDKYREISVEDRSAVTAALGRILQHLQTQPDPAQLPEHNRVAVFNDQSLINTILTQAAADSRLICRRERTVGSNMPQNNCLTVAERRRQKNNAQDSVMRMQRTPKKVE